MSRSSQRNYDRLRLESSLWNAWRHVFGTGRSASIETRRSLAAFKQGEVTNIGRLKRQLRAGTFDFGLARGAPIQRPGKKARPIVIPKVEARIVQRALLDELQRLSELRTYFESPHSFGGVVGRNREEAVAAVQAELENGAGYFLRSDISEFFTKIPRDRALDILAEPLDVTAAALLRKGTYLELDNAAELGELISLFPTESLGAAQGLCLSPLMGNVILHDFDQQMNGRKIRCIRFVDDFILLGPDEHRVFKAFEHAIGKLKELGMTAYDPRQDKRKAQCGPTSQVIDFLGCAIERGRVQPNRKARSSILARVQAMLDDSQSSFSDPARAYSRSTTLSRTLYDVGNTLRGWRDSFKFCGRSEVFTTLDAKIDQMLADYLASFRKSFTGAPGDERRLLLGIPLLARSEDATT